MRRASPRLRTPDPAVASDVDDPSNAKRTIARRRFTMADQRCFADLSGDHNPIHMDPVAARRTIAGASVVHGVHLLLWALDALAASQPLARERFELRVRFLRFVYLDAEVQLDLAPRTERKIRMQVVSGGVVCCSIDVNPDAPPPAPMAPPSGPVIAPDVALDIDVDDVSNTDGRIGLASVGSAFGENFPSAAAWLGGGTLGEMAATTRLVGMVYPGLHSIFIGLTLTVTGSAGLGEPVAFHVHPVRYALFRIDVAAKAIAGRLEALRRVPPVEQPGMAEVSRWVPSGAFAGTRALVIGGSRGLGELAAKMLAAGGADVTLTYQAGLRDAMRVVTQIRADGGAARAVRYDATQAAGPQLTDVTGVPTHIYYFAAPRIARTTTLFFDQDHFDDLKRVFLDGFLGLAEACLARGWGVRLFYPSTTFIEERPRNMAEYAMLKAAGEVLCAEMTRAMSGIVAVSRRLPPLASDQTAGLVGLSPSQDTMLEVLRAVQESTDLTEPSLA